MSNGRSRSQVKYDGIVQNISTWVFHYSWEYLPILKINDDSREKIPSLFNCPSVARNIRNSNTVACAHLRLTESGKSIPPYKSLPLGANTMEIGRTQA
jgi:hypothetical protein